MREMLIGAIIEEAIRINSIENTKIVLMLTDEKELVIEYQGGAYNECRMQWVINSKNNEKYLNSILEELKGIR